MTVEIHSHFETVVIWVNLKVLVHMGARRGRALFMFVYHCDVIARA